MADDRYKSDKALRYLNSLVADGDREQPFHALESLARSDSIDDIRPAVVPPRFEPIVERTLEKISRQEALDSQEAFALEAIIIPDKRPAIDVRKDGTFVTDHPLWIHLNSGGARGKIDAALPSVGRIELPDHPSLPYGGTGFVVGDNLLMTNRHVAEIFSEGLGLTGLRFRSGLGAGIDFQRCVDGGSHFLKVNSVALIHPYWDMALLRVAGLPEEIEPLTLADEAGGEDEIVVIGYPAFDPRNNVDVQREVFGNIFNVKRLMPGRLTGSGEIASFGKTVRASMHDSSTLGGASGSAVLDLATGRIVALHFGGIYLKSNYGVPAFELAGDSRVVDAGVNFASPTSPRDGPWTAFWQRTERARETAEAGRQAAAPSVALGPVAVLDPGALTIPLTITIGLGQAHGQAPPRGAASTPPTAGDEEEVIETEAVPEDYRDRKGYDPDALGSPVPLPAVTRDHADILEFAGDGSHETELRYEHFSVVMSRSRRMCFFSAVNIDGGQSRKARRVAWRRDPRIPPQAQIIRECYGNPPKFSRGHMTRREDPIWGSTEDAERGNADSMHVTNTTPQMQAFNSPIWLALEDYALDHARRDAMKIAVFTGPFFGAGDPEIYGVRIPIRFWKVIAFIHDDTGELCATGYAMDQSRSLPAATSEFVFGQFVSPQLATATQLSVRAIEREAGIDFHGLADRDPLDGMTEALSADMAARPLQRMSAIRFT